MNVVDVDMSTFGLGAVSITFFEETDGQALEEQQEDSCNRRKQCFMNAITTRW